MKGVNQSSFVVNWIKNEKEPVPIDFSINQTSLRDLTIIFKLIFPSPSLVSASSIPD
jgi:hypothetical protein